MNYNFNKNKIKLLFSNFMLKNFCDSDLTKKINLNGFENIYIRLFIIRAINFIGAEADGSVIFD